MAFDWVLRMVVYGTIWISEEFSFFPPSPLFLSLSRGYERERKKILIGFCLSFSRWIKCRLGVHEDKGSVREKGKCSGS